MEKDMAKGKKRMIMAFYYLKANIYIIIKEKENNMNMDI